MHEGCWSNTGGAKQAGEDDNLFTLEGKICRKAHRKNLRRLILVRFSCPMVQNPRELLQSQVDLRRRPKQVRLPCVPIPINVPGEPPTAADGIKRE